MSENRYLNRADKFFNYPDAYRIDLVERNRGQMMAHTILARSVTLRTEQENRESCTSESAPSVRLEPYPQGHGGTEGRKIIIG